MIKYYITFFCDLASHSLDDMWRKNIVSTNRRIIAGYVRHMTIMMNAL
jgi:hypothetical protein